MQGWVCQWWFSQAFTNCEKETFLPVDGLEFNGWWMSHASFQWAQLMEVGVAVQGSGIPPSQLMLWFSPLHILLGQTFNGPYALVCYLIGLCQSAQVQHVPSPLLGIKMSKIGVLVQRKTRHQNCHIACTITKDLWYNTPIFILISKWLGCLVGHEVEMHPLQPGGPRKVLVCKDYLKVTI